MLLRSALATLAVAIAASANAQTQQIRVEITSNAPTNGVFLTPIWVGFHDGSFDSYNGGLASTVGLERLAEDGNNSVLSDDFNNGRSYIENGASGVFENTQALGERVDGTLGSLSGPPPLQPGEMVSQVFTIDTSDNRNLYFSYAAMVLPTNDFFVANGNPLAHSLQSVFDGNGPLTFNIGLPNGGVNDAATEAEDFDFAAPATGPLQNLFPNVGFGGTAGQIAPNQSSFDDISAIANVIGDPFADFANADGLDLSGLNFNDASLYSNGIATITITAVPEPTAALIGLVGMALVGVKTRRRVA